jgi:hypothetical protein
MKSIDRPWVRRSVLQQRQDLRLNGDVQGGGRLVRNQQARAVDDGHGDEDALALAAGELVRVIARAAFRLGQGDLAHGVEHQFGRTAACGRARAGAPGPLRRSARRPASPGSARSSAPGRSWRGRCRGAAHLALGQREQVDRIGGCPTSGFSDVGSARNQILPLTLASGGSSRSSASAVADLPEPDSPTRPSVSPASISNEMSWTASLPPKPIDRPSTRRMGAGPTAVGWLRAHENDGSRARANPFAILCG